MIQISVNELKNKCILKIKDNGIGMKNETINEILSGRYETKKNNGLGIALKYAKMHIESWKGEINISSSLNSGTEVNLEFLSQENNQL